MTNPIETLQALQEKARRFAEDWHEGVPKDDWYKWCCGAAGVLLSFSSAQLKAQPSDEREAFEAWAKAQLPPHKLERAPAPYQYEWASTAGAWEAWQARASLGPVKAQQPADSDAFKNFHRALCERFNYFHDEVDWRRDQVSLIEHIAAHQGAQPAVPEFRGTHGEPGNREFATPSGGASQPGSVGCDPAGRQIDVGAAPKLTDEEVLRLWNYEAGKSGYNTHELPVRFARALFGMRHAAQGAQPAVPEVQMPLEDAQMLLSWMDATFGNDKGVDWHDEDAAAVGDALEEAIDNFKRMHPAALAAAPSASAQPAVPEGFKLVPALSTATMNDAGVDALRSRGHRKVIWSDAEACYLAMLAAAPSASAQPQIDFDTWAELPYTKTLLKSVNDDYVPKQGARAQELQEDKS